MIETRNTGRLVGLGLVLLFAWAGLGARLTGLHLLTPDAVRLKLENRRILSRELDGRRGRIFDRNGRRNTLALDLDFRDVIADPKAIAATGMVREVAAAVSPILGLRSGDVETILGKPDRRYARLKKLAPLDVAARVEALKLPGISFEDNCARFYPQKSVMCHVVGFANHQGYGGAGIEQAMDRRLRGRNGRLEGVLDGRRREIYDRRFTDLIPEEGADVYLTLDQNLQYMVERELDKVMDAHRPVGACAVMQRISTGEILAMASRPSFDLNRFYESSANQRTNRAIGIIYEPGSTLKSVAISAILNEKIAGPSDTIFCENGSWAHAGKLLRDTHPYGTLTVADILKKSSNIGTAKLSLMLGEKKLHEYMTRFGIGSKTGLDLPCEEAGILHPVDRWTGISSSRIAIGQGVAVTAVQMLNLYCTIANDGVRMRPYVVSRVVAKDGTVMHENHPAALGSAIRPEVAREMQRLLARVTEEGGTGYRARIEDYPIAGKTGSAQKPVPGGYSSTDYVASFVGFLPAGRPEIGIIVMVDTPQPYHTGGVVAAPAFREIAAQSARYLAIPAAERNGLLASR